MSKNVKENLVKLLKEKTEEAKNKPFVKKHVKELEKGKKEAERLKEELAQKLDDLSKKEKKEKPEDKKSSKRKKVEKVINTGAFGCNTLAVAKLCSVILEETIEVSDWAKEDYKDTQLGLENRYDQLIHEAMCPNETYSSGDLPLGTMLTFFEEDTDYRIKKGTYMFIPDVYGDVGGYLLNSSGKERLYEYFDLMYCNFSEEKDIKAFVDKMNLNKFSNRILF